MNPGFWQGRKVLITGHTGFKGSWLALWLQHLGANVIGYSLPSPTSPNLFESARVGEGMISHIGDVRDLDSLKSFVSEHQPEITVHMAAQALVRHSYANPVETYATNVMGTVNVLEAARQSASMKAVVVVTSDKCYDNRNLERGYHEDDPMGGHDPYSSSKGCAELVTAAYRNSYFGTANGSGIAVASARAGNVIGGGDWAKDRLIPDIVRAILENRPLLIRNPNAVRPWQHVLEPLAGYMTLVERLWEDGQEFADGWNFGPDENDARPVSMVVEYIAAKWGDDAGWAADDTTQPHEANLLKLNSAKARKRLGWAPKLPLETALDWVIEWYRDYRNNPDMRQLTTDQILRYQSLQ